MTKKDVGCLFLVLVLVLMASDVALACPICFRVEESATTDGIQAAVAVLLGVTTVVLGGFVRFAVGFVRRERSQNAGRTVDPAGTPEIQE